MTPSFQEHDQPTECQEEEMEASTTTPSDNLTATTNNTPQQTPTPISSSSSAPSSTSTSTSISTSSSSTPQSSSTIHNGIPKEVQDHPIMATIHPSRTSFVITNPHHVGNPIIFASPAFLQVTGYSLNQVLGRDCRFLQGPETDPSKLDQIRDAVEQGQDISSVKLVNYRQDGSTFWIDLSVYAIRPRSLSTTTTTTTTSHACEPTNTNTTQTSSNINTNDGPEQTSSIGVQYFLGIQHKCKPPPPEKDHAGGGWDDFGENPEEYPPPPPPTLPPKPHYF